MPSRRSIPYLAAVVVTAVLLGAACGPGSAPNGTGSAPASTTGGSTVEPPRSTPPEPTGPGASPSTSGASSSTPATSSATAASEATASPAPFTLTSSAFRDGGTIPKALTCDGADRSPPLSWTGVPSGAAALVLVVDDPDANDFVHWLVLDLPADTAGSLPGDVTAGASSPQQGRNGFGRVGWGGPCPPSGTHHYRFTLSALAAPLHLAGHPDGAAVRAALRDATVVARARLTGTYRR